MATEFLHLPKIPLHGTPARERGPHAQAGTNQSGFLSPGAPTHMLCRTLDAGNARCSAWVNPARQLRVLSPRLGAKDPSASLATKKTMGLPGVVFKPSSVYQPPVHVNETPSLPWII